MLGESTVRECRAAQDRWIRSLAERLAASETESVLDALTMLAARIKELDETLPEALGERVRRGEHDDQTA